jgi:hypothetical protein
VTIEDGQVLENELLYIAISALAYARALAKHVMWGGVRRGANSGSIRQSYFNALPLLLYEQVVGLLGDGVTIAISV